MTTPDNARITEAGSPFRPAAHDLVKAGRLGTALFAGVFLASACTPSTDLPAAAPYPTLGSIERLTPAIDAVVAPGAIVEVLAEGFAWSEGPVWAGDQLLFSDVPNNRIHAWSEAEGLTTWLEPAGYTGPDSSRSNSGANGLLIDAEGRLVLCQHGDRRMARLSVPVSSPAPTFETIADRFEGRRFNSPNDAAFGPNGSIWFTDPPYGLDGGDEDQAKEMPFNGVFAVRPDGTVTVATDTLTRPNGIGFSPDQGTLYVAVSDPQRSWLVAYDIDAVGTASNGRLFFDATPLRADDRPGLPDGLKVTSGGTVFATGPGGVLVLSPAGELLGTIRTQDAAANVALSPDESILYITASSRLLRVRLKGA